MLDTFKMLPKTNGNADNIRTEGGKWHFNEGK